MKKVLIIGGGLGGLASAIVLAKQGYDVELFEKNEQVGGRASVWEKDGFRFDMGPSWYLMPDIFEMFFTQIGENINDYLDLTKLDPSYRIYFLPSKRGSDSTFQRVIDISPDLQKNLSVLETRDPGISARLKKYLKNAEIQYKTAIPFMFKNYNGWRDLLTFDALRKSLVLNIFQPFAKYVKKYTTHPRIQKILQYPLVFLGTSPYQAPALYSIMSHVDFELGVFYPQGGIYAIVDALKKICAKYKIKIHLNIAVDHIIVHDGLATGIRLKDKRVVGADIVIANADMAYVETHLLPKKYQTYPTEYRNKKVFSPSAFIIYLGVKGKIKNLQHHTLIFSDDWKKNFDEIFQDKILPTDPSMYICTPSKTDPTVAPEGDENLFVLVPIPNGVTITNDQESVYRKKILTTIEKCIGEIFEDRVMVERIFSVKDFEQRYNARHGTALGLAHTLWQTAAFRPQNFSSKIKNLFYVGHNTHPGIGMPMVLVSAILVAQRVKELKG